MYAHSRLLHLLLLSTLISFVSIGIQGCKKGGCNVIPDIRVMERISLVEYPQLRLAQQAVAIPRGGVSGLIVVNLGGDQYMAYDRCSTVDPHKRCAVEVDGLVATDPCSQAKYILTNGSPADIAECPLKPYRAYRSGETIIVSN